MQNEQNTVTVKSLHRVGKTTFESKYGTIELEIRKQRGGSLYHCFVDGRDTGLSRSVCEDAYLLLGEYLGIYIVQGEIL